MTQSNLQKTEFILVYGFRGRVHNVERLGSRQLERKLSHKHKIARGNGSWDEAVNSQSPLWCHPSSRKGNLERLHDLPQQGHHLKPRGEIPDPMRGISQAQHCKT